MGLDQAIGVEQHRLAMADRALGLLPTDDTAGWVLRLTEAGVAAGQVNDVSQALAYADRLEMIERGTA